MSLPNPGMDAVPFTTLTAEFLDNMIENIESLADGSGLDTNSVTASKLATSAITLGYAQITSDFTTTGGDTQVTGLSCAVTIPAGGRKVRITAYASQVSNNNANTNSRITIWDGAVGSGTQLTYGIHASANANNSSPMTVQAVVTPSAGSKTYNVGLANVGGGTAKIAATTTGPAFILVETI